MNEETKRKLIEAYIAGGELLDMFDEIDRIEEEAKRLTTIPSQENRPLPERNVSPQRAQTGEQQVLLEDG